LDGILAMRILFSQTVAAEPNNKVHIQYELRTQKLRNMWKKPQGKVIKRRFWLTGNKKSTF